MALNSDILREKMATEIEAKDRPIVDKETLDAIAIAIVDHIKESAVATVAGQNGTVS